MGVGRNVETAEELAQRHGITVSNSGSGTGAQRELTQLVQGNNITVSPQQNAAQTDAWRPWGLNEDIANLRILWSPNTPALVSADPLADQRELPPKMVAAGTMSGDFKTVLEGSQWFAGLDPNRMGALQAALYNAGYIKSKRWQNFGQPDEVSVKAWQTAMVRAHRQNKTIWQVLGGEREEDLFANGQTAYADATAKIAQAYAPKRQPLTVQYANPDELKAVARQAAQNTLGYVPDDDYLNDFVKLYHGLQATEQRGAYNNKSRVTSPGSADVQASKLAEKQNPVEADAYGIVKQFDAFLNILGVEQ